MKHTKGKWSESSLTMVVSEEGRVIANCMQFMTPELSTGMEESVANTHLIAAAPELLEACEACLINHEARRESQGIVASSPLLKLLNNAIAKAKGE